MHATKIGRFSGLVRVIGYIFVIPSVLGIVISIITMFGVIGTGAGVAEADAVTVGAGAMAVGTCIIFGIISLVGGLIGWILIMKKKVFKCVRCGHIIDRA